MPNGNNQVPWWYSQWWQWPTPPAVPPVTPPTTPAPPAPAKEPSYPWGIPEAWRSGYEPTRQAWEYIASRPPEEVLTEVAREPQLPAGAWESYPTGFMPPWDIRQIKVERPPETPTPEEMESVWEEVKGFIPPDYAILDEKQKYDWLKEQWEKRWLKGHSTEIYTSDLDTEGVTVGFVMPSGVAQEIRLPWEEYYQLFPRPELATTEALRQLWYAEEGKPPTQKMRDYNSRSKPILASDMSYYEKQEALMRIYQETIGTVTAQAFSKIKTDAWNSLSAEEKKWVEGGQPGRFGEYPELKGTEEELRQMAAWWMLPREEEPSGLVDVKELTRLVSPFGITVMAEYPYLSPITEAHLRVIPQDALEMMSRYLTEKGLDWRDWLAISEGFYGGRTTPRVQWGTPRQW